MRLFLFIFLIFSHTLSARICLNQFIKLGENNHFINRYEQNTLEKSNYIHSLNTEYKNSKNQEYTINGKHKPNISLTKQNLQSYYTTNNSVLSSGEWYKIKIQESGIYKLTYNDLISIGISDPKNLRIYGNGGENLPLMNDDNRPDDLIENAIFMNKGTDGIFNSGDYILFYAEGPTTWKYDTVNNFFYHKKNNFSLSTYYYITSSFGEGKRVSVINNSSDPVTNTITSFDDYDFYEKNIFNAVKSGRQWFGSTINNLTPFQKSFIFLNRDVAADIKVKTNLLSRSATDKTFTIKLNSNVIGTVQISSVDIGNHLGIYGIQKSLFTTTTSANSTLNIEISYPSSSNSDEGRLDYITVNARRMLILEDTPLFFRDASSVGSNNIAEFHIQNTNSNTQVWDITDIYNIKSINTNYSGGEIVFRVETDSLRNFVAFNSNFIFKSIDIDEDIEEVQNQNLHSINSPDLLIITHPNFISAANDLAQFHQDNDNMEVFIATTNEVYNEFSSGIPDICAIRDFAKMVYEKSFSEDTNFKYMLLMGDGSYNNLSEDDGNPNFIPTYQSSNSLDPIKSYVSDDFFGFFNDNEGGAGSLENYVLDIGIGRIPVKDSIEAQDVVNKIKTYHQSANLEDWKNILLFVGDDQDGNIHMTHANNLAEHVKDYYPGFVIKKILLDAYTQISNSSGTRYPDVNESIINNFNKGILIFNYSGHGGEAGLAEEHIIQKPDILELSNGPRFPLFVTATCEFSRFDDISMNETSGNINEVTSAGETALLNPDGGSIALLSTTRVVYANDNYQLNLKFYQNAFKRGKNNTRLRLGDIIKETKIACGAQKNKLNFTLLGDPALTLAYPEYGIVTDSLNGTDVNSAIDTLKAFAEISVSGHIIKEDSTLFDEFHGVVYPSVFDKEQVLYTLANDGGEPMSYQYQENIIYKGRASVNNGKFSFKFIVPKDISYNLGSGKISYYAQNTTVDANGFFDNFLIGGTSFFAEQDNIGPEISLFLNDTNFRNGGITNQNPVLFAKISDESGINTTGNGIGHDITGLLDMNSESLILNDFYQSNLDQYKSGELYYQIHDLEPGWHTFTLKVWDVYNNSSEKTINFRVLDSEVFTIDKIYNYPNPFSDCTYFQFEHNFPDDDFDIIISIYDISGRMVHMFTQYETSTGFRENTIYWDGRDSRGNKLPMGIYIYRIKVRNTNGETADSYNKLIIH